MPSRVLAVGVAPAPKVPEEAKPEGSHGELRRGEDSACASVAAERASHRRLDVDRVAAAARRAIADGQKALQSVGVESELPLGVSARSPGTPMATRSGEEPASGVETDAGPGLPEALHASAVSLSRSGSWSPRRGQADVWPGAGTSTGAAVRDDLRRRDGDDSSVGTPSAVPSAASMSTRREKECGQGSQDFDSGHAASSAAVIACSSQRVQEGLAAALPTRPVEELRCLERQAALEARRRIRDLEIERRAIELERCFERRIQHREAEIRAADGRASELGEELEALRRERAARDREYETAMDEARQAARRADAQGKQKAKALQEAKERVERGIAAARSELKGRSQRKLELAQHQRAPVIRVRREVAELRQRRLLETAELRALEERSAALGLEACEAEQEHGAAQREVALLSAACRECEAEAQDVRAEELALQMERGSSEAAQAERRRLEAQAAWLRLGAEEAALREELGVAEEQHRALRDEEGRVSEQLLQVRSETASLRDAASAGGGEDAVWAEVVERDELRVEVAAQLHKAVEHGGVAATASAEAASGREEREGAVVELTVVYEQLRAACERDRQELADLVATVEGRAAPELVEPQGAEAGAESWGSASWEGARATAARNLAGDFAEAMEAIARSHEVAIEALEGEQMRLLGEAELGLCDLELLQLELMEARRREEARCEEVEEELRRTRASPSALVRALASAGTAPFGALPLLACAPVDWWHPWGAGEAVATVVPALAHGVAGAPLLRLRSALSMRLCQEGSLCPQALDREALELREKLRSLLAARDASMAQLRASEAAASAAAAKAAAASLTGEARDSERHAVDALLEERRDLEHRAAAFRERERAVRAEAAEALFEREAACEREAASFGDRAAVVEDEARRLDMELRALRARARGLSLEEAEAQASAEHHSGILAAVKEELGAQAKAEEGLEEAHRSLCRRAGSIADARLFEEEMVRDTGAELMALRRRLLGEEIEVEVEEAALQAASMNFSALGAEESSERERLSQARGLSESSEAAVELLLREAVDEELLAQALEGEAALEAQACRRARESLAEVHAEAAALEDAATWEAEARRRAEPCNAPEGRLGRLLLELRSEERGEASDEEALAEARGRIEEEATACAVVRCHVMLSRAEIAVMATRLDSAESQGMRARPAPQDVWEARRADLRLRLARRRAEVEEALAGLAEARRASEPEASASQRRAEADVAAVLEEIAFERPSPSCVTFRGSGLEASLLEPECPAPQELPEHILAQRALEELHAESLSRSRGRWRLVVAEGAGRLEAVRSTTQALQARLAARGASRLGEHEAHLRLERRLEGEVGAIERASEREADADTGLLGEMRTSLWETLGFLQEQRRQLEAATQERDQLQAQLQAFLGRAAACR